MANIHRMQDLDRDEERGGAPNVQEQMGMGMSIFGRPEVDLEDPRSAGFCLTMRSIFCPYLQVLSFISMMCLIDVFVYILTLFHSLKAYGTLSNDPNTFIGPRYETLMLFGAKYPKLMKGEAYEWYRWIMPILLHGGFMHLTMNLISQLILGALMERILGMYRACLVYFLSGFGGILLGCLVSDAMSVGASGAIFGLCGALVGWIVLNWELLDYPNSPRGCLLCMSVMLVVIILLFGFTGSNIDNYGHVGGLLVGIVGGMAIGNPAYELAAYHRGGVTTYDKRVKLIATIFLVVSLIAGVVAFFGFRKLAN